MTSKVHDVPEVEPPIGTVATFSGAFSSGGGYGTDFLLRTEFGWARTLDDNEPRSWAELTDLNIRNGKTSSGVTVVAIRVVIIAHPKRDEVAFQN